MISEAKRGRFGARLRFYLITCIFLSSIVFVSAQDHYDDYVKEVLEEDQQDHYDGFMYEDDNSSSYQENLRQQEEDPEQRKAAEQERLEQEKIDGVAREREEVFQKELAKMDEEKQKVAIRQKKKDAKLVRCILKAAANDRHYAVLGIRNWQLRLPPREFNLAGYKVSIPGVTVKHTTTKDIRKAYRNRALAVHPDKNRDGFAVQAFIEVEKSASILSDENLRKQYDKEMKLVVAQRRAESKKVIAGALDSVKRFGSKIAWIFRKVLGPFATPVLIILALLI
jgi:hypothetical protein